ncbi:MAG: type II toxin-antitoxin system VapC family toxin [Acidobacteria bacterium]|nr:type II toxin-antitoxin system VapC family toxin [Acidobacteriota bacterium]
MRRAVLWDSSAILALLDADDADHRKAAQVAARIATEKRPSFITNYIETEAHALLLRKLGRVLAREWLLAGGLSVLRVHPEEETRAKELLVRYADKDWSLCDAISFAVIDRRNVAAAFSFDRHFLQFGRCEVWGL